MNGATLDFVFPGTQHWLGKVGADHAAGEPALTGKLRRNVQRPRAEVEVYARWSALPR